MYSPSPFSWIQEEDQGGDCTVAAVPLCFLTHIFSPSGGRILYNGPAQICAKVLSAYHMQQPPHCCTSSSHLGKQLLVEMGHKAEISLFDFSHLTRVDLRILFHTLFPVQFIYLKNMALLSRFTNLHVCPSRITISLQSTEFSWKIIHIGEWLCTLSAGLCHRS